MKIDVTSDIHIDFWINPQSVKSTRKQTNRISSFISNLIPKEPSDTLVIAGDIGHYNWQNLIFLEQCRVIYKDVIWVHGNHDLYLVSSQSYKTYSGDSFNRLNEMIEMSNSIAGVHYLNGNIININNFIIGGSSAWYDNGYGSNEWNMNEQAFITKWRNYLNDANYIYVTDTDTHEIDSLAYSNNEKKILNNIVEECDLIVTHIAPDWTHTPIHYLMPESTFYSFDGRNLLSKTKPNAKWLFGHTHDRHSFTHPIYTT